MLPIARPSLPPLEDYVEILKEIWSSRMLSNFGKYAQLLEAKVAAFLGNPHVAAVSSGDTGLVVALAALGRREGSTCIVPSFTFNSTVNAIVWNRLRPQFVDIDPETFNVDVEDVARRITPDTAAVVATHVFGSPADIDALLDVAGKVGVPVVFDAAHAYGARLGERRIGAPGLGDLQVFSLSGTKPVTSAEGGLVAASSAELADKVTKLRAYGFRYDYISELVGLNGKLSELHAALGCLLLDGVDAVVTRRNEIAERYRRALAACPGIGFQRELPASRSTYKDFAILCPERRDELAAHLGQLGVQTKRYFRPLHTMPAFEGFATADDDLADTEEVRARILCLPVFNELEDRNVDEVCDMILAFYASE